jgi:hypothetical protein
VNRSGRDYFVGLEFPQNNRTNPVAQEPASTKESRFMQMPQDLKVEKRRIARPLKVLVPLIKTELAAGYEAGLEHYRRAGEMLNEAKDQVSHGSWTRWLTRNFELSQTQARRYMRLARAVDGDGDFKTTPEGCFRSIKDVIGEHPARAASQIDFAALRQADLKRVGEHKLKLDLAAQLIDIGFKVLASKLHPDKGGSPEAMTLLNEVRDELKHHAWRRR